ncbi:MAG TPA: OmpA family protein [Chryseolinea sp.]|nr:OmpA family protein [Chryseolinea sp.]
MKHTVISLLVVLFAGTFAFGQHSSNAYRDLADSLYRHHHYQYAATYYEKAMKKAENPGYLMLQLGKCYDKVNKPRVAEQWFRMAVQKRAPFTDEDYYLYAEALVAQQKYQRADSMLEHILSLYPEMNLARTALTDIRNLDRFYADSSLWKIHYLALNTEVAEFSPVRFKDGIVFSSARQEGALKKKYHWDNSHFLNLYYARKVDGGFANAELFEKDLNTRHHDGPAMFYDNFQKMVVNRNQRVQAAGREEVYELRPGLYDAHFDSQKSTWDVSPLPFNNSGYSYAHPCISEDGSTLYFSSDMSGGYGGMDLYRVTRTAGVWGTPFNLGPAVNSIEDDVFPFVVNKTLYFSSNGHGGLGGLDIFVSEQSANGFAPPVNAGFPVNSFADDLSFTTDSLQREGYFSSARKGSDDIYAFVRVDPRIQLLAHIYDGETRQPLAGSSIQVMTNGSDDQTLVADQEGNFSFQVPKDMSYIIIGTHGDLIGMVADIADSSKHHQIPAYRDTTRLACIGFIKNELGLPQTAAVINIVDQTTGQTLPHSSNQSIIAFRGEKGHRYHIEAVHALGNRASHQLAIAKDDYGTKEFTIILNSTPAKLPMAARVFKAEDNQPIAGAQIRILTFGEEDMELTGGSDGIVDFQLTQGQAYVIIASKDGLSGMHSGMAEVGEQKDSVIHPIPVYGDKPNTVLGMGLVTNKKGNGIDNFRATVTNKKTGESMNVQANRGLLTFLGERGSTYDVNVEQDNFETAFAEVSIPADGSDAHKFSIVMKEKAGRRTNEELLAPLMVAATIPATLLFLDTEDGKSKAFISSNNHLDEIKEKNGELTVQQGKDNKSLGKGTIAELRTNPEKILAQKGLSNVAPILLRSVYFDFDKHNLDQEDMLRLNDVKKVIDSQPGYQLTISGHADDRGKDNYNERLSRRRASAVAKYLIAQGMNKNRIVMKAYGESRPAIPCTIGDCSEDVYRLNRRAEFLLLGPGNAPNVNSVPDAPAVVRKAAHGEPDMQVLLREYGNKAIEGVSFMVNVGAYRKKHDLKFPELSGIGTVESVNKKGVTYYFLTGFRTLGEAEQARKQAVAKGISDASISVYRNGDRIKIDEFAALVQ